jgi:cobalt/nickel transport system permease protein
MIIFEVPERSVLRGVDPRVRVTAAVAFAVPVCLMENVHALSAALALGGLLASLACVSPARLLRSLKTLNFLMLVLAIFLPLLLPGEPAVRLGALAWSRAGLVRAVLAALLATMEPAYLGLALNRLGAPRKLTHILLFMVRYIEVIHVEYHRLRDALRLRGFRAGCDRHTCRTLGYLIGLLLVRSLDRSERILEAMKCRGFRNRFYVLAPFRLGWADLAFGVAVGGGIVFLSWMAWK